jgi:hypothetical protein
MLNTKEEHRKVLAIPLGIDEERDIAGLLCARLGQAEDRISASLPIPREVDGPPGPGALRLRADDHRWRQAGAGTLRLRVLPGRMPDGGGLDEE